MQVIIRGKWREIDMRLLLVLLDTSRKSYIGSPIAWPNLALPLKSRIQGHLKFGRLVPVKERRSTIYFCYKHS